MHPVIAKTFGGLSRPYYVRQFIFGFIFPVVFLFALNGDTNLQPVSFGIYVVLVLNTLLYPYARFVYESIVDYVLGKNVFFVNAIALLFVKFLTMAICWAFAVFIAPIGLLYLYIHHSRNAAS